MFRLLVLFLFFFLNLVFTPILVSFHTKSWKILQQLQTFIKKAKCPNLPPLPPSVAPNSSTPKASKKLAHCGICAFPAPSKCAGCNEYGTIRWNTRNKLRSSNNHPRISFLNPLSQAWPKHKRLCKIYQNPTPPASNTYCGLCGKSDNLTRTECCDRAICDDEGEYQMFSYSNVSCSRNHRRSTLCGYHYTEEHAEEDWRKCEECIGGGTLDRNTMVTQGTCELPSPIRGLSYVTEMLMQGTYFGKGSFNFNEDEWNDAPELSPTRCLGCKRVVNWATEPHCKSTL